MWFVFCCLQACSYCTTPIDYAEDTSIISWIYRQRQWFEKVVRRNIPTIILLRSIIFFTNKSSHKRWFPVYCGLFRGKGRNSPNNYLPYLLSSRIWDRICLVWNSVIEWIYNDTWVTGNKLILCILHMEWKETYSQLVYVFFKTCKYFFIPRERLRNKIIFIIGLNYFIDHSETNSRFCAPIESCIWRRALKNCNSSIVRQVVIQ